MSKNINTGELKIISTSDDYPENAFGASPDLDKDLGERISSVIIAMYDEVAGRKVRLQ